MKLTTRRALLKAAEVIGANNHARQIQEHLSRGRKRSTYRFTVTPIHAEIVQALNEDWQDDTAMALLHTYEHDAERYGKGN